MRAIFWLSCVSCCEKVLDFRSQISDLQLNSDRTFSTSSDGGMQTLSHQLHVVVVVAAGVLEAASPQIQEIQYILLQE